MTNLRDFLDASPTPHHVCHTAAGMLQLASYSVADYRSVNLGFFESERGAVSRDGALIAWNWPKSNSGDAGVFLVGAHTDSPGLRLKPHPSSTTAGWNQLNVEIYGGVLLNSWLDRDLGVAGRIFYKDGTSSLFDYDLPLARVPQLAIHLDRDISDKGLLLNRQHHMKPVWGTDTSKDFTTWLAEQLDIKRSQISSFDLSLYDIQKATFLGADQSLIASGRLDNQVSCWAATSALLTNAQFSRPFIVALFDHEEVGSQSINGAGGPLLEHVITELLSSRSMQSRWPQIARRSLCISADNAHGIHPNYQDRHDQDHAPRVNAGPVVKFNTNQRYATSHSSIAHIEQVANNLLIPLQTFVSNNAQPCGSTIGPITSSRLGVETVDIGIPQISMHSAREMCGSRDPDYLLELLTGLALANSSA